MRQRAVAPPMLPMEHLLDLGAQGFPNDLGGITPRNHRLNIARQMRPAQLPPPGGIPAVPTPAIRHQPAPEALPREFLGHLTTARPLDREDRLLCL